MGMAAPQARLLAWTNRKNAIGLDLSMLSAQKMSLANEADKIALNYNEALNSKVLKWSNDAGATMHDLTYNTLMQPSQLNNYEPYMLTDMSGKVVVDNNYLKYAKMISSNGAAGGNYEGNRLQILSELMGIDSSQFYATEAHATRVSNIEAAILEHKKQEPELVYDTADNILTGLGKVSGNAATARGNAAGDAQDVTSNTTWDEIIKSISAGDNFVTYLTWDGSEQGAIDKFAKILTEFSGTVQTALGGFNGISPDAFTNAYDKTFKLFTEEFAYSGSEQADRRNYAGENASKHNTICHQRDAKAWFLDNGPFDAYAVSLTNMAAVFLTYLFEGESADVTTAAGQNLINLKEQKLPTKASQKAHDEWQAKLDELNAQLETEKGDAPTGLDAEQKKKIDFYDAIFNAIAKEGWVHNENINDPEYLSDILQTGIYNITQAEKENGIWLYDETCPTTCQNIFQVTDSNEINKITAEYEMEKRKISKKEDAIDVKMQKLETEQTALKELIEATRNMINENTENTFDTFS